MKGFCYVTGEFALVNKSGKIIQQMQVSGYSKIDNINTDAQREYLYETAVQHARSKFLHNINKPSDADVDWAIIDYGFKRIKETPEGFNRPYETDKTISKKNRNKAEERVFINVENKRNDKNMETTRTEQKKMYKKESRVQNIAREFKALTPKERKELIKILQKQK